MRKLFETGFELKVFYENFAVTNNSSLILYLTLFQIQLCSEKYRKSNFVMNLNLKVKNALYKIE